MAKFFIIKGIHEIEGFVEINDKAHIKTKEHTLKIRESTHSNSFFIDDLETVKSINKLYDTEPLCYEDVLLHVPEYSFNDILKGDFQYFDLKDILTYKEIIEFAKSYHLMIKNTAVLRIVNKDVIKVLCYLQSIEKMEDFNLINEDIKNWALSNFKGTSAEIGFYLLLEYYSNENRNDFMKEWRNRDLNEPKIEDLVEYIKRSKINNHKELLNFLLKF